MHHSDLYLMRDTYNREQILLCFNGPFSQGLIEEIGEALKRYMETEAASSSAAFDVFAIYIEIAQNIRHYSASQGYDEANASATVVISRGLDGTCVISAGNVVEAADGRALMDRIDALSAMDQTELKAAYKNQLRRPREDKSEGAGLGLIDISRKARSPISCHLYPLESGSRCFFSLRVEI